ncbi:hypothetical protein JRQ81_012096, partial [Phrynocephalus forsythii]
METAHLTEPTCCTFYLLNKVSYDGSSESIACSPLAGDSPLYLRQRTLFLRNRPEEAGGAASQGLENMPGASPPSSLACGGVEGASVQTEQ